MRRGKTPDEDERPRMPYSRLVLIVGLTLTALIVGVLVILALLDVAPTFAPVIAGMAGLGAAIGASRQQRSD